MTIKVIFNSNLMIFNNKNNALENVDITEECKTETASLSILFDIFICFHPVLIFLCMFIYCEAGITPEVFS